MRRRVGSEMSFPDPRDCAALEWTLRYGTPTRSDLLEAASVIGAYVSLCDKTAEGFAAAKRVLKRGRVIGEAPKEESP